MASSAGGGGEFTALPPRDCIRKRTRRPADQVPVALPAELARPGRAAAAAAAAADGGDGNGGAVAEGEQQQQQQQEQEQAASPRPEEEEAAAGGAGEEEGEKDGAKAAAAAAGGKAAAAAAPDLPAYRSCAERGRKFEYLDHTADVQIHAWGSTLEEALENAGLAMFNYMTPIAGVRAPGEGEGEGEGGETDEQRARRGAFRGRAFSAEGHDADSLVFAFLDELLFAFASDLAVCSELKVTKLTRGGESGEEGGSGGGGEGGGEGGEGGEGGAAASPRWRVEAVGAGERFDRDRHEAGTEIKAITYSAMQVIEKEGDAEIFVIVDI